MRGPGIGGQGPGEKNKEGREGRGNRRAASRRPAPPGYRAEVVEVLTRLLAKRPEVRPGKMFGFPAFYTRGKLFACVYGDGVGLKVPEVMVRKLDGNPGITPFQPYGMAKMKEWIHIARVQAEAYAADAKLFQTSIAYVGRAAARGRKSGSVGRGGERPRSPGSPRGAGA